MLVVGRLDLFLGDGEHPTRAAAGIADLDDCIGVRQLFLVAGEQQLDHEVDDVPGCEVLAGVLVECFVELADELFEDGAHRVVFDEVGVEVDALETLDDLEQES